MVFIPKKMFTRNNCPQRSNKKAIIQSSISEGALGKGD
jgi:hypothetical protein